jgi:anion-transporting  ArsA/GET3 family ATPase
MVKKAHLVTGKGGVGKSLFAAALAQHLSTKLASQKPAILLTELNEHSFYRDFLNQPQIQYRPTSWKQGVDLAQWAPEDCLKEYALHLLKIETLYKLFIENPVTKSLIEVAPGLQDLALLGKLTSSPRGHGPPMNYEEIVVDSYSTGHFIAMLKAPLALQEAIPFGPMGEQTKSISSWIRNTDFTHVHLVCLPEELPVSESLELYERLQNEFGIKAEFYLNKISGLHGEDLHSLSAESKIALQLLLDNEKSAREKIAAAGITFKELPLIPLTNSEELVFTLAKKLGELL